MSSKSPPPPQIANGLPAASKDPEKERKKAEKLQKFNEKKAKAKAANAQATQGPSKTMAKKAKQDTSKDDSLPPYVEKTPRGEKKSMCSHVHR